jgi:hypothetical protein
LGIAAGAGQFAAGSVAGDCVLSNAGKCIFDTNGGSGTPILTLAAGNGAVGIGTPSPKRKLDVSNAGQITFGDDVVTDSSNGVYWHSGVDYGIYRTTGPWSAPNYQQLAMKWSTGVVIDGGTAYGKSGTILQPNGGNVGIGTTNPSGGLFGTNGMTIAGTYPAVGLQSGSQNWLMYSDGNLHIYNAAGPYPANTGVDRLIISSAGKVGIGTTALATDTLTVAGGIYCSGLAHGNAAIYGLNPMYQGKGVFGQSDDRGYGVYGFATGTGSEGVHGESTYGVGVFGKSINNYNYAGLFDGSVYVTGAIYEYSDLRAKKDVATIPSALDKILALRGVYFNWQKPQGMHSDRRQVGVIAQEIEQVFPELVNTNKETGSKSVNYNGLVAPLIQAVKEQQDTIKTLESRLAALEALLKK